MISKKRYFDFNPNYFKRKAENIFKKKNIITIVLDCILKIYFKYRKFLHLVNRGRLIKRIMLIFKK